MKTVNKENLLIQKNERGEINFTYSEQLKFSSTEFDEQELINVETKEKFKYKDIILYFSSKEVYFYPPELFGTKKVIEDYKINNWYFVSDPRARKVTDASFKSDAANWIEKVNNYIDQSSTAIAEYAKIAATGAAIVAEATDYFRREYGRPAANISGGDINTGKTGQAVVNYNNASSINPNVGYGPVVTNDGVMMVK